jgi:hypothetical protein
MASFFGFAEPNVQPLMVQYVVNDIYRGECDEIRTDMHY